MTRLGGPWPGELSQWKSRACADESTARTGLASPKPRHTESIALPIAPDASKKLPEASMSSGSRQCSPACHSFGPRDRSAHLVDAPSREALKRGQPGLEYDPGHGLTSEDFSRPAQPSPTSVQRGESGHAQRAAVPAYGWVACAEADHDARHQSNLPPARVLDHDLSPWWRSVHAQDMPRLVSDSPQGQSASTASFSVCRPC